MERYSIHNYNDTTKPSIFFGCYSETTVNRIFYHKSLSVIVWGGSDARGLRKWAEGIQFIKKRKRMYEKLRTIKNVKHIAISEDICEDLKKARFNYRFVPVCPVLPNLFNPTELGSMIYSYGYKRKPELYGRKLVEKVERKFRSVTLLCSEIGNSTELPYEKMRGVYDKCFIGLRFTKHDGLPNTVIELGLMGRKCIHNSNLPNAIRYESFKDIVGAIQSESTMIGCKNKELAEKTYEYINIPDDWLDTRFYG